MRVRQPEWLVTLRFVSGNGTGEGAGLGARGLLATTHWSVVLTAGQQDSPEATEALEHLCRSYWYPLYAYVRRQGYSPADAQDLTQGFFLRLLQKNLVAVAQADRGKFRWFLLASLRHYLANEWDRAKAQRRGGRYTFIPLDEAAAEDLYRQDTGQGLAPEKLYDRAWAVMVMQRVRDRLREEYAAAGKAERLEILDELLPGEEGEMTRSEAALRLGLSAGGVRTEIHRLRRRYGELLRAEVAHTVSAPNEIEEELRHLIDVMSA